MGGYLDTDVELFQEIPKEWCGWNSFWFYENELGINTGRGFGSIKKNELLEFLIEDYNNSNFLKKNGKLDMETCVSRNTKALLKFFSQLDINDKFQVIDGNAFITTGMYNLFARHHYASSWIDSPNYNVEKKSGQRNTCLKKFLRNSKRREWIQKYTSGRMQKMYLFLAYDLTENGILYFAKRWAKKYIFK